VGDTVEKQKNETISTVLKLAIKSEEAAYNRYRAYQKDATLQAAQELFAKLAKEEKKHKERLQKIDITAFKAKKPSTKTLHILESLMLTPLNELHELKKILKFAIQKEQQAHDMYAQLAKEVTAASIKSLLLELAKEEAHHKALLSQNEKFLSGH
jgi:rubrerythrin